MQFVVAGCFSLAICAKPVSLQLNVAFLHHWNTLKLKTDSQHSDMLTMHWWFVQRWLSKQTIEATTYYIIGAQIWPLLILRSAREKETKTDTEEVRGNRHDHTEPWHKAEIRNMSGDGSDKQNNHRTIWQQHHNTFPFQDLIKIGIKNDKVMFVLTIPPTWLKWYLFLFLAIVEGKSCTVHKPNVCSP